MVEITHIKPIISKNPNVTPIKIIANIVADNSPQNNALNEICSPEKFP